MKKQNFYNYSSLLVLLIFLWAGCSKDLETQTTAISIDNIDANGLVLEVDEEVQVDVKALPQNVSRGGITYQSNDESIFSVSAKGIIKGIKVGEAELVIKTQDGTYLRDSRKITVFVKAESIEISDLEDGYFLVGHQYDRQLEIKVLPEGTSQSVIYTSSDESVFTVDENGVVTGLVLDGEATLTVQSVLYPEIKISCSVKIVDLSVKNIIVPTDRIVIRSVGGVFDLKANVTIEPIEAANVPLEYISSNPAVLRVNENGLVTSLSRGEAKIIIKAGDNSGIEREVTFFCESELSYEGWTVTASSTHPGNGTPGTILIDGVGGSEYWHSNWDKGSTPLPHWLLIDMKAEYSINTFRVDRRHTGRDLRKGIVEVSNDGQTFTKVGEIYFGDAPQSENTREITFGAQKARYIRFTITESNRAPFASVNRIRVYGVLE